MSPKDFITHMQVIMRTIRPRSALGTAGNLTMRQIEVLMHVAKQEQCSMGDVARHLQMSASAATQSIQALVQKDLLKRSEKTEDRRQVWIALTEKARKQRNLFEKEAFTHCTKLLRKLSLAEQELLENLLQKITPRETFGGKKQ